MFLKPSGFPDCHRAVCQPHKLRSETGSTTTKGTSAEAAASCEPPCYPTKKAERQKLIEISLLPDREISSFAENVIYPARDFVLASRRKRKFASVPDNSEPELICNHQRGGVDLFNVALKEILETNRRLFSQPYLH
jgi:hypothetical protein